MSTDSSCGCWRSSSRRRNSPPGDHMTTFRFYLDAVDFIRNYADRFHHAKEEDVLFVALVENGMPREHSPVAAMLMEHDQGRAFVKAMEEATLAALAGKRGQEKIIAENARGYIELAARAYRQGRRYSVSAGGTGASGRIARRHYRRL